MVEHLTPTVLFFSLLGGLLPAVFWLWFWLKEDKLHPEPRGLIILSFLVGMLATAAAYPIEQFIESHVRANDLSMYTLWALTEESLKYIGISIVALHSKYFDEPIDAVIYLITIALGFSALENSMFLINFVASGKVINAIVLGNFRFIGATLLHVAASGMVGVALALTFYHSENIRRLVGLFALGGAVILHTLFNFSIIVQKGAYIYEVFGCLWLFVLGLLLICERIKRMPPRSHVDYAHTGTVFLPHNIS